MNGLPYMTVYHACTHLDLKARQERERDLLQSQRALDARLQSEQRELADVKGQLERLRGAKGGAEARAEELEAALKQQEMAMASLR